MNATWSKEFENMWRNRLAAMRDGQQPFRKFIEKLSELEITDAFTLAIDELDRRDNEAYRLRHILNLLIQYKGGIKVSMTTKGIHILTDYKPYSEVDGRTLDEAVILLANKIRSECQEGHWLRNELLCLDLSMPKINHA